MICYQDSAQCGGGIVMHGAVMCELEERKIKVFALVADLEHFHLALQNICIILWRVDGRDQDHRFFMQTTTQRIINKT